MKRWEEKQKEWKSISLAFLRKIEDWRKKDDRNRRYVKCWRMFGKNKFVPRINENKTLQLIIQGKIGT